MFEGDYEVGEVVWYSGLGYIFYSWVVLVEFLLLVCDIG